MVHRRVSPAPSPHPTIVTPSPSPQPTPPSMASSSHLHPPSTSSQSTPSKLAVDLSPPLIAMIIIIGTAFVIITYSRLLSRHLIRSYRRYARWRRRRRRPPSSVAASSPPYPFDFDHTEAAFHVLSPYGLEESIIKTIPLSIYSNSRKSGGANNFRDCAVCLLEFEDNDYVRSLPVCNHEFHVDCIDIWLRSHANCPLCRAGIFNGDSPFTPLMAARIRPSLDDVIFDSITVLEPLTEIPSEYSESMGIVEEEEEDNNEITLIQSPRRSSTIINHNQGTQSEDRYNRRDFLLKRSYSFSFERSLGSERSFVLEPATASPWRFRRGVGGSGAVAGGSGSFWSKRLSPFSSISKPRVFSFRYCRGIKYSPFQFRSRRNSVGSFLPLSESSVRFGSSRRAKSTFASPMFVSRLRSGDPEALLSPERLDRR